MNHILLLIIILLPIVFGLLLPVLKIRNRRIKLSLIFAVLVLEAVGAVYLLFQSDMDFCLWSITDKICVTFNVDDISKIFSLIATLGWLLVGVYSFKYMTHEEREDRFYCFFLLVEGMLLGMDYAADLVTMYLFYEFLTLMSIPLVLHELTKESIAAALKFLFYSVAGAFMALFGICVLSGYLTTLGFTAGGALDSTKAAGHESLILAVTFVAVVGCGAKAGLFPLHGWLPAAHPVAPAPASAVLSAIIAKAGVLAIIRILFFSVGTDILAGTWVQTVLLILALLTVFMGSMMAYREKILKKRLAYSTVSQISYVLTGVFLMSGVGLAGGLLHVIFHATIKTLLFLVAGAVIFSTGKTRVEELRGIGKEMPVTMWCFTLGSLALIGIPPASGFVSKWYLAEAALDSGLGAFTWLVPVVLLVSALLTAGYLLPIAINGFFPGRDYEYTGINREKKLPLMCVPIVILAILAVGFGIWSGGLTDWVSGIVNMIC
jgi:formate hydrogenlyase subunit 3/multisubunit Na+/H+ antiporter MnhD subunit